MTDRAADIWAGVITFLGLSQIATGIAVGNDTVIALGFFFAFAAGVLTRLTSPRPSPSADLAAIR